MKLVKPRWETPKPRGVHGTYGAQVREWAIRRLGITPGPWQQYALDQALVYDRNGNLIRRNVLISSARQNGKSVIVRLLYGWVLDEGHRLPAFSSWREMLAAAHDAKQARLLYRNVHGDLASLPDWKGAASGSGPRTKDRKLTEQFGIRNGALVFDIVTGQPAAARGHSAGALAWDEVLTQDDWEGYAALSATQSAQLNPILVATSTAGFANSVVLRSFYDRLVRVATGQEKPDPSFYGSWWQSEDPHAGMAWKQVAMANPALGDGRLTKRYLQSEYAILPAEQWQRERLNHWVDVVADAAFNPVLWRANASVSPLEGCTGPFYLGVDVHPGWERATVSVAAMREDGRVGLEVWRDLRQSDGELTVSTIIAALDAFPGQVAAVIYEAVIGPAAELGRHGEGVWGTEYRPLKPNQVVASCIDFMELMVAGRLAVGDPLLDAQIPMVAKRPVGQDGAYRWSRAHSTGPIDGVFAATFAAAAAVNASKLPAIL